MNWQPIETAPRDGTTFLVCCDSGIIGMVLRHPECAFWIVTDSSGDPIGDAYGDVVFFERPTHWMPLPAAPIK